MSDVGVVGWGALAAAIALAVTLGGVLVRLTDRLNRAEAAVAAAAGAAALAEKTATALVDHRIQCAREFVSQETLKSLRMEILDAMHRIEERLDKIPHRA